MIPFLWKEIPYESDSTENKSLEYFFHFSNLLSFLTFPHCLGASSEEKKKEHWPHPHTWPGLNQNFEYIFTEKITSPDAPQPGSDGKR